MQAVTDVLVAPFKICGFGPRPKDEEHPDNYPEVPFGKGYAEGISASWDSNLHPTMSLDAVRASMLPGERVLPSTYRVAKEAGVEPHELYGIATRIPETANASVGTEPPEEPTGTGPRKSPVEEKRPSPPVAAAAQRSPAASESGSAKRRAQAARPPPAAAAPAMDVAAWQPQQIMAQAVEAVAAPVVQAPMAAASAAPPQERQASPPLSHTESKPSARRPGDKGSYEYIYEGSAGRYSGSYEYMYEDGDYYTYDYEYAAPAAAPAKAGAKGAAPAAAGSGKKKDDGYYEYDCQCHMRSRSLCPACSALHPLVLSATASPPIATPSDTPLVCARADYEYETEASNKYNK